MAVLRVSTWRAVDSVFERKNGKDTEQFINLFNYARLWILLFGLHPDLFTSLSDDCTHVYNPQLIWYARKQAGLMEIERCQRNTSVGAARPCTSF
jgi:hypothetical protein